MKKILIALVLLGFFASCGPHRMKCGTGRRCLVEKPTPIQDLNTDNVA